MNNGMASDARARVGAGDARAAAGVVVMGLDQHRAQITADWLDTATGELGRQRVAPGDRIAVRQFLARFSGRQLEVALRPKAENRSTSRTSTAQDRSRPPGRGVSTARFYRAGVVRSRWFA